MHFNVRKILFHSTHFRPTFLCTHLEFFIRSKIFYPLLILTIHIVRSLSLSLSNTTSLFLALFFFFLVATSPNVLAKYFEIETSGTPKSTIEEHTRGLPFSVVYPRGDFISRFVVRVVLLVCKRN